MMHNPWENDNFTKLSLSNIDRKFEPLTQQQVSFLMDKMELKKGDNLLDLGCGAGRHSIEFSKKGVNVTGIDISPIMIYNAKERTKAANLQITYYEHDLAKLSDLELLNNHYNGAICLCESGIGVIGGSGNDYKFFKEIYNLMLPGSVFVLSCFNAIRRYIRSRDTNPKFDYINSTMLWSAEIEQEKLSELERQYTPSEMNLLLSLSGFKNISIGSCVDSVFSNSNMGIEDIEMLVFAEKS
jgi:cyclopropane fatty-acyl-phospholipid synthase-like methyltransferase